MKKAVVLFSGGLDSAVLLHIAGREGYFVFPVLVNYGQQNWESEFAAAFFARPELHVIDVSDVGKNIECALTGYGDATHYPSTVVPLRNTLLMTLAGIYAVRMGAEAIFIGVQGGGGAFLDDGTPAIPDASEQFIRDMQTMLRSYTLSTRTKVRVRAPLLRKTKRQVVKMARSFGIDLASTWSCFEAGTKPCGKCPPCVARTEAER